MFVFFLSQQLFTCTCYMLSLIVALLCCGVVLCVVLQERVKSVFHAKEFGKIINFRTPEIAKVTLHRPYR